MNPQTRNLLFTTLTAAFATLSLSTTVQAQGIEQEEESRWSFYGDARFRLEFNDNAPGVSDRHRQRMRFRLGANFVINDEITVGARATTGNADDPRTSHVDLGDGFNSLDFTLDRFYVQYQPSEVKGLTILGGKFHNPIYRNPVYGELVWDADIQPEGIAAAYGCNDCGIVDSFGFQIAQVAVLEQSASEEAWATLLAMNFSKSTGEDQRLEGGVNYSFFGDLTPGGSAAIAADLRGNALSGSELTSDFGIIDAVLAYHTGDFVVSGEFINNIRAADTVGDTGMAVGAAMKTDAGKFYYQYSTVEQDAVLTALSQDDMLSTTNFNNHMLGWKKTLTERTGLHIWVMASEPNEMLTGSIDETVYRFRVDFNFNL